VGKDWGNKKCWGFWFIGYICTILCYFLNREPYSKGWVWGGGCSAYL
jgi:hypothetical protein